MPLVHAVADRDAVIVRRVISMSPSLLFVLLHTQQPEQEGDSRDSTRDHRRKYESARARAIHHSRASEKRFSIFSANPARKLLCLSPESAPREHLLRKR